LLRKHIINKTSSGNKGIKDLGLIYKVPFNRYIKIGKIIIKRKVTDKNIGGILVFFNEFEKWMETSGRSNEYDFDIDSINIEDYVYIDPERNTLKNYTIYLYDTDTHTLYYIHSNI